MSDRRVRIISLIHELAATFVAQEANTNPMITITNVTTSPDYRSATIYITTIPDGREQDALIWLKRKGREMRHFIMKKSDLKIIPRFDFAVDMGEKHRQHTDEVFREIEQGEK